MNTVKTIWRWWWGWEPEMIENWLECMEEKGWSLIEIDLGAVRFRFKKGEPRKIKYCADYQINVDDQYYKLFTDDGWSLVWSGAGGWYLWKKAYGSERPEIYTDTQSLIDRNKRWIKTISSSIGGLLPIFVVIFMVLDVGHIIKFILGLYLVIFALTGYILYRLHRQNNQLIQNRIKE